MSSKDLQAPTKPRTEAGRRMLRAFTGVWGARSGPKREVLGIREGILAIEREAARWNVDALAATLHANPNYPCKCGSWPCQQYVGAYWADQAYEFIAVYEVMHK